MYTRYKTVTYLQTTLENSICFKFTITMTLIDIILIIRLYNLHATYCIVYLISHVDNATPRKGYFSIISDY